MVVFLLFGFILPAMAQDQLSRYIEEGITSNLIMQQKNIGLQRSL